MQFVKEISRNSLNFKKNFQNCVNKDMKDRVFIYLLNAVGHFYADHKNEKPELNTNWLPLT